MKNNYLLLLVSFMFTLFVRAQAPGNISVNASSAASICNPGESSNLNCTFFQTYQTTGYTVSSIPFNPPFGVTSGSSTSLVTDDIWSGIIDLKGITPLDFNFCFYNNSYVKCLVTTNGAITFSVNGVVPGGEYTPNGYSAWQMSNPIPFSGPADQTPFKNSISGVLQDTNPAVSNAFAAPNINYYTTGTYPNRVFVLNVANVAQFGCSSDATVGAQTSQIMLYEGTNIIDVYVKRRYPCASWNSGNGIIGVQNGLGTIGTVAPGRNLGTWQATNEAWRFTPNGVPVVPTFQWTDNLGNIVGTTQNITVTPSATTTYTVTATYPSCSAAVSYQVTDQTTVELIDIPTGVPLNLYQCNTGSPSYSFDFTDNTTTVMASLDPGMYIPSYHTTQESAQGTDANLITGSVTNYTTTGGTVTIWVAVEDLNTGCRKVHPFDLIVRNCDATPIQPPNLVLCDNDGNTTESFDLTPQNTIILGGQNPANYTITYHTTLASADGTTLNSALIPAGSLASYVSSGQTIYVRLEDVTDATLFGNTTFQLIVNPRPTITGTLATCVDATTQLSGAGTPASTTPWTTSNAAVATVTDTGLVTGIAAGTATITYTDNNGCFNTTTVTVNGLPIISGTLTACQGASTQLTGSDTPAVVNPWVSSNTSVATISTTGLVTGINAGTTDITYTNANGCSVTTMVTINPLPTISGTFSVCVNSTTQLSGAGVPASVTPWISSNPLVATVNNTGLVSPVAVGTTTITYTDANGCSSNEIITVNPLPTVVLTSALGTDNQTLCVNTALNNITYTVGNGATAATVSGLPNGVTGSFAGGVFTISGTPNVSGTFNYTVTTIGGCTPDAIINGTIVVNPLPSIVLSSSSGTDAQTLCVNTAMAAITYAVADGATGAVVSGLPSGVTGSFSSGVFTISGTPNVSGTFNYTITTTGGCSPAATAMGTIIINSVPTIALSSAIGSDSQTICVNTAVTNITYAIGEATGATVSGLPSGVTGSFAGGVFTISGTPIVSGTFNYTVTTTGGCAPAATATGTITVNPLPTIVLGSALGTDSQTLCVNTLVTTITYTVGNGATGATISGLPNGVNGSFNAGVFTISGTPSVSGTFNYTVTTTGGCTPAATASGTLTVNPLPAIVLSSVSGTDSQTICVNTVLNNITYTVTGGATAATVTGLPTGVSGSYAGGVFTISGTPSVSGTFNYTVTTSGGCAPAATISGTITANPLPTIVLSSALSTNSQTLCVDSLLTDIIYTVGNGATGATVSGLPTGVTGGFNAGVFTISGTPSVSGTFNYTVTTTGGCAPAATASGTITVNPAPTITLSSASGTSNQTICVNTLATNITYILNNGATGATVSGLPGGVTGNYAAGVFTISGTPNVSGTFNYTVTTIGGCTPAAIALGTITVTPTITPIFNPIAPICWGGTTTSLPTTSVNGITGTWSPTLSNTVTTYTFTPNAGQCAATTTINVTFIAAPVIAVNQINHVVCDNVAPAIVLSSTIPGTTYSWSASTSNIEDSFALSGDETTINQVPQLTNPLLEGAITYVITPSAGGCNGNPITVFVRVNPIPVITSVAIDPDSSVVCSGESITMTIDGDPIGTQYQWNAVNANGVAIAGGITSGTTTGVVTITLSATNTLTAGTIQFEFTPVREGCTGTTVTTGVITVNPIPGVPVALPPRTICSEELTNLQINVSPLIAGTELIWEVVASSNVTGYSNGSGIAPLTINQQLFNDTTQQGYVTYKVTTSLKGCLGGTTFYTVFVNPLPKIAFEGGFICIDAEGNAISNYLLDTGLSSTTHTFVWLFDGAVIAHTGSSYLVDEASEVGEYTVVATNVLTGCESEATSAIILPALAGERLDLFVNEAFSDNATITAVVIGGTGNYEYSLDGGPYQVSNVFSAVTAGLHTVQVRDLDGCTDLVNQIYIVGYPKFFTPNGDGYNDTWNISDLRTQPDAEILIFDRYGKLLKQLTPLSEGWDGTFNGEVLPSTDYWFTVKFNDKGVERIFKAHFSMKR